MDALWEADLDDIYHCEVTRKTASLGVLRITKGSETLLEKEVSLAYGAAFGPDIDDVMQWQNDCLDFVDSLPK